MTEHATPTCQCSGGCRYQWNARGVKYLVSLTPITLSESYWSDLNRSLAGLHAGMVFDPILPVAES